MAVARMSLVARWMRMRNRRRYAGSGTYNGRISRKMME
jgi:hypothetical protein